MQLELLLTGPGTSLIAGKISKMVAKHFELIKDC